jgi:hypothetical protein
MTRSAPGSVAHRRAPSPNESKPRDMQPAGDGGPSSFRHRLPAICLALGGCGIATYLALYQWHVFGGVWEPFFGDGSRHILRHSVVATMLPIPDATFGAAGYLFEAAAGAYGDSRRWRTRPWIVLVYGLMVLGFTLGSLLLVIAQGAIFHAWCTLCLASALASFCIAGLAYAEPLASLHYLNEQRHRGRSLWRALWGLKQSKEIAS